MEPIFLRRPVWTSSSLPEFIGEVCDVTVAECGDAMANGGRLSTLVSVLRVLEVMARRLVSGEVLPFSTLLADEVGVRGTVF